MGYIKNNNSKVTLGTNPQQSSMIFKTDGPLDDRAALATRASLISKQALGARKAGKDTELETDANIKNWVYPAMTCAIQETGEIYVLKDKAALQLYTDTEIAAMTDAEIEAHINAAWTRQALRSDLESISSAITGVFQFKGLATDISPDSKSIIIMTVPTSYTFIDILYDYAGEPFYKWQTPDASNQNQPKTLYTDENGDYYNLIADSQSDIQYVILANKIFYAGEDTVYRHKDGYLNEGEEIVVQTFEALDGECIYFYKSGSSEETAGNLINRFVSLPPNDSGELVDLGVGNTDIQTFTAYKFEYSEDLNAHNRSDLLYKLLDNGDFQVIQASSDNSGHVYQIGENEYASNGTIWVKLGSPVEDWIIL